MLTIPLMFLLSVTTQAPGNPGAAVLAPFLDSEVGVVGQVDLTRLGAPTLLQDVVGKLADEEDVTRASKIIHTWSESLRNAGARELFVLVNVTDLPNLPVVIFPLKAGNDGRELIQAVSAGVPGFPIRWPAVESLQGAVVAGPKAAVARLRDATFKPVARPDVTEALSAATDASIRIAFVPSATHRRAIEESMENLPAELGGGPIGSLSRGLRWALIALSIDPQPTLHVVVQARDAEATKPIHNLAANALKLLTQQAESEDPALVELTKSLGQLDTVTKGDRITLDAKLSAVAALVQVPLHKAQESARNSQCKNNLKQIGLAMHNYHAAHNSFPPAFRADKGGKPLLSWRVLILPYLDQNTLYQQFKLDEAWDSPHNKALISKMPPPYACPSASRQLAAEGKTSYLTPRNPGTIFPGEQAIKLQEIVDGTSNTILVLEANEAAAVPWTKPVDWDVPSPAALKELIGHHRGGTNVSYADGSVRFLSETLTPTIFQALLTRAGGEVIPQH